MCACKIGSFAKLVPVRLQIVFFAKLVPVRLQIVFFGKLVPVRLQTLTKLDFQPFRHILGPTNVKSQQTWSESTYFSSMISLFGWAFLVQVNRIIELMLFSWHFFKLCLNLRVIFSNCAKFSVALCQSKFAKFVRALFQSKFTTLSMTH